jgi:hypothetical protein
MFYPYFKKIVNWRIPILIHHIYRPVWLIIPLTSVLFSCSHPFKSSDLNNEAARSTPLESLEVYTVATFPVRVHAVLQGHVPETCMRLSSVQEEINAAEIHLNLTFSRVHDNECRAITTAFEEIVPLSVHGLAAGGYVVTADGHQAHFELLADNF